MKKKLKQIDFISLCTSALRRKFSTGPIIKRIKDNAILKNIKGVRGGKMVGCYYCGKAIPSYKAEVEHIECVVPVFSAAKFMDIPTIFKRMFLSDIEPVCSCKKCHEIKTSEERKMRVWWRRQKRYMVYETKCKVNNKLYIGVHGFIKIDDGYLGSGKALLSAIKKYGKENFERRILKVFHLEKQAYEYEAIMVPNDIVKDLMYYNIIKGGNRKGPVSAEEKKLQSNMKRGKYEGKDNPNYGKIHSDEPKRKIANRYYPTGEDHPASRSVTCVETGEVFKSIIDIPISNSHLSRAILSGGCMGGFHWYYTDDGPPEIPLKTCKRVRIKVRCVETGEEFPSMIKAGQSIGHHDGSKIGQIFKGARKTVGGYHWERLN